MDRLCKSCTKEFKTKLYNQKYCSVNCRLDFNWPGRLLLINRNCAYCSSEFKPRNIRAKFCSEPCRVKFTTECYVKANPQMSQLSSGSRGAVSELLASIDLLNHGFEVFRSVSPSTSCDLIATKAGKIYKIEVRTARRMVGNTISTCWKNFRADVYALVLNMQVLYLPDILGTNPSDSKFSPGLLESLKQKVLEPILNERSETSRSYLPPLPTERPKSNLERSKPQQKGKYEI